MNFSPYRIWERHAQLQKRLKLLNELTTLILAVLHDTPHEAVLAIKRAPKALGYLCGMHESVLQGALEASAQAHGPSLLEELLRSNLRKLFGHEDGSALLAMVRQHREEAEFRSAMTQGRVEFARYAQDRITPMGLVRLMPLAERPTESEFGRLVAVAEL